MGPSIQNLKLKDYVNPIVQEIKKWDMQRIVIIAHSFGGIIGLKVAEEVMYQQLSGFIAIGAAIPQTGDSYISSLPFPKNIFKNLAIRIVGDEPPKSAIKNNLCNDLSLEVTQRIIRNYTPESKKIFFEKVDIVIPDVKRMYIKLQQDNEFKIAIQDRMAANLKPDKVLTINSGHLPMLSIPEHLTNIIKDFIREIDKSYFNPTNTDFTPKVKKVRVKNE
jgi:pimeloyl-ACP methyl ester carboxylesterase